MKVQEAYLAWKREQIQNKITSFCKNAIYDRNLFLGCKVLANVRYGQDLCPKDCECFESNERFCFDEFYEAYKNMPLTFNIKYDIDVADDLYVSAHD